MTAATRVGAPFSLALRVYYEDTDAGGIVYYANYLKFIERSRSEALLAAGIDQLALRAETGLLFVVRRVAIDYLAPGRLFDWLDVTTAVHEIRGSRIDLAQAVLRGGQTLVMADVTVVCVSAEGRPQRIPEDLRTRLASLAAPTACGAD